MKVTITNNGVAGVDAITIFTHKDGTSENLHCVEGGESFDIEWDGETRYEVVPWYKVPPKE
jgi:hypothetical protein